MRFLSKIFSIVSLLTSLFAAECSCIEKPLKKRIPTEVDIFLGKLNKINKYKKIVELEDCNHDEKDHTEEELELMRQFNVAMLEAVNRLRTDPGYYLEKIKKERDNVAETLRPNDDPEYPYCYTTYQKFTTEDTIYTLKVKMDTKEDITPYKEAIEVLEDMIKKGTKLKPYLYFEPLMKSSLLHAKAMAKHNFVGHSGICWPIDRSKDKKNTGKIPLKSDNEGFNCLGDRVKWFVDRSSVDFISENFICVSIHNLLYTNVYDLAEENVMDLFVDVGVLDRGHRKLLIDRNITHLGSAIYENPIKKFGSESQYYTTVMNFCSKVD